MADWPAGGPVVPFTPILIAVNRTGGFDVTAVQPNLGAAGAASGSYSDQGVVRRGKAGFFFSGAGLSGGAGELRIRLPFLIDDALTEEVGFGKVHTNQSVHSDSEIVPFTLDVAGVGTNGAIAGHSDLAMQCPTELLRYHHICGDTPFEAWGEGYMIQSDFFVKVGG